MKTYESAGFDVVAERHLNDPGNDSFASYKESHIADLCRSVASEASPDAIVIFCTNFRGAAVAPIIEKETGIVVIDTVSTALWKSLCFTGMKPNTISSLADHWGKLFTLHV